MIASFLQSLSDSLDIPGFNYKKLILGFTFAQWAFETVLTFRQNKVLGKPNPPETLKFDIDAKTFKKSQTYSKAKAKFSIFTNAYSLLQNFLFIQYDVLPLVWQKAGTALKFVAPYLPKFLGLTMMGEISQSMFFILFLQLISLATNFPIECYQHFVLEEKFGFNKLTFKLFLLDTIKMLLLSIAFGGPLIAGFLKIVLYFGDNFALYAWGMTFAFQLVLQTIFPTVIQPLFNKVEPLEKGELRTSIEELAKKNRFPLTQLFVIDGSKRSTHSNAYFMGLPWSKQIVLYDTLIKSATIEETTAVLAHEIGHWALSHNLKMMIISNMYIISVFSMFSLFIHNNSLFNSFGFYGYKPVLAGFWMFNYILSPFDCVFTFFNHIMSRKHEYEADNYAVKQGYSQELSRSLIKLQIENLSAMDADWLYSAYHYSHPILSERLKAIGYVAEKKVVQEKEEKNE
ncbi:zinc metalloprotease [Saccharomycopsis crataegensis]|uniref:CAAX prenyl protease n=1 Tax=Saccharomycopsis crataegensis TaxID=43959 RepID=A0AAV5QLU9_9ASCO|nr:zinc metalloprotease [Saccharomycopsis crataegensis]